MTEKQEDRHPDSGRLGSRVSQLEVRQSDIGREVRQLKDLLDIRNNSHATLMGWIGSVVMIITSSGNIYTGKLLWIDKYNVCIFGGRPINNKKGEYIVQKGNIEAISLANEEH